MNKLKLFILFIILIFSIATVSSGEAQEKDYFWIIRGIVGASYNLTLVSANWSGSEENNYSWVIRNEWRANRIGKTTNWENWLDTEYGQAQTGEDPVKNQDRYFLESLFYWKIHRFFNPYLNFTWDTQFTTFNDPVQYKESAGILARIIKQESLWLTTRAGWALVQDIDSSRKDRLIIKTGPEWINQFEMLLNSFFRLRTETRYFHDVIEGEPDIRWDTNLYLKLNAYLTASIGYRVDFKYNKEADPPQELPRDFEKRFIMVIGFSYNLFRPVEEDKVKPPSKQ
jgi:hypothetical protein